MEICAFEVINGEYTGHRLLLFIHPKFVNQKLVEKNSCIKNYYFETGVPAFVNDKEQLKNFSKFIQDWIIITHNVPMVMESINHELKYWGLKEIPIQRFCFTMLIFREMLRKFDPSNPLCDEKFISLEYCCEFFEILILEDKFPITFYKCDDVFDLMLNLREKLTNDQCILNAKN